MLNYYAANRDRILARKREYYQTHKSEIAARRKQPEIAARMKRSAKVYRDNHRGKAYRQERRKEIAAYSLVKWDKLFGVPKGTTEWTVAASCYCDLCGEHFDSTTNGKCVDHDHETGAFRGILHRTCNAAIGMFMDNAALCHKAADYLNNRR